MSAPGAQPRHPRRELLLASLFFLAVTVVMTWPQAMGLGDGLTDLWDAKLNAWILQWDVYQGLRRPLDLFQAPFFYPARYVLAFSENLVGAAVFGVPLILSGASPVLDYNVLLLLGMFLSALAAWALAREVTGDAAASLVAGLVYAFLPWRLSQLPHLQFQWGAFLCLLLLFLIRYLRAGARRDLVLYAVAFAWNALTNVHYAIFSAFAVGAALVVHAASASGAERSRRLLGAVLATAAGGLVFLPFALTYARASALYGMVRHGSELATFSGRWSDFLSAGERNRTWGPLTTRWYRQEGDFFAGVTAAALAAIALARVRREPPTGPAGDVAPRRGILRALDLSCAAGAILWIASIARPGLRLGPLRLGDSGRVLVILTALVLLRLWIALPWTGGGSGLPDRLRRSRLEPALVLFALLAVVGVVVALGVHTPYYRFLFVSFSRIFGAIRAPSRGIVLFDLALAVLAAWGLSAGTRRFSPPARRAAIAAAVLGIAFEYRGFPLAVHDYRAAPAPIYRWARGLTLDGALIEWPFGPVDAEYVLRQADHRQRLVNGYSGFFPPDYLRLQEMLSRPWIRDPVWPAMRAAGARVLIYHSGDAELARRASYRRAIRGALERRWITFLHASRGETGVDLAFWLGDHAPPADVDAASRAELDRFLSITDAELMAPVVGIEFTEPVAPGAWHGGWAVDDSGVAEIRIDSELGPVGLAMLHMRHGGLARAFPDIPEAADDRAGFGFAIPKLPPGRHTLTFTVVANDGGVTVVKRPVEVLPAR